MRQKKAKKIAGAAGDKRKGSFLQRLRKDLKTNYMLYLMILPVAAYYLLFSYVPMTGIQLAFKNYRIKDGIWGSPWVGLAHFRRFFSSYNFSTLIWNTLAISLYCLIIGAVIPVLFSVLINYIRSSKWKKTLQMVTYLPYFISWVVMWGLLYSLLNINGPLNEIFIALGINDTRVAFLAELDAFIPIAVLSDLWKGVGWSSILYLAAISNVPQDMYEAAYIDGANRFQRCIKITLPSIMPTVSIMLIMAVSGILGSNFDQHLLLLNANNVSVARTIDIYVYQMGIQAGRYSYATAVNLARSVVSMALLFAADRITRWVSDGERGLF